MQMKITRFPLAIAAAVFGGLFGAARGARAGANYALDAYDLATLQKSIKGRAVGHCRTRGAFRNGENTKAGPTTSRRSFNIAKRIRRALTLRRTVDGNVRASRIAGIRTAL